MTFLVVPREGPIAQIEGDDVFEVLWACLLLGIHPPMKKMDRDAAFKHVDEILSSQEDAQEERPDDGMPPP